MSVRTLDAVDGGRAAAVETVKADVDAGSRVVRIETLRALCRQPRRASAWSARLDEVGRRSARTYPRGRRSGTAWAPREMPRAQQEQQSCPARAQAGEVAEDNLVAPLSLAPRPSTALTRGLSGCFWLICVATGCLERFSALPPCQTACSRIAISHQRRLLYLDKTFGRASASVKLSTSIVRCLASGGRRLKIGCGAQPGCGVQETFRVACSAADWASRE